MRITRLQAENVKRLKAIDISPDGTVQVIAGRNAQGKTSVLDSILLAFQYAAGKKINFRPIRDGEEHASITVELSEAGKVQLNLTRTFTAEGSILTVTSPEGAKFPSPQKMLDELVGNLSMDPLAFANAAAKEQLATLLGLVELSFDPDTVAKQRAVAYDQRADVNRRIKALEGQIAGMKVPPAGLPESEISSSDVLTELRDAEAHNSRITDVEKILENAFDAAGRLAPNGGHVMQFIQEARGALPQPLDVDAIHERLSGLEQTNALIREGQRRAEAVATKEALDAEAAGYTARIQGLDAIKAQGLAAATMPLEGLGFDDNGVTYQGQPFAQASGAEQLRVSLAIAMALNPKLRVIRITDGSLLDSTNMTLIEEMAKAEDFQIWVERVDQSGSVGIVIEDGEVAS